MWVQDALISYSRLMRFRYHMRIDWEFDPKLPCEGANLFQSKPDAIAKISGKQWPVYAKLIRSELQSLDDIITNTSGFFVGKSPDGNYFLKRDGSTWCKCQTMMALYHANEMVLSLFNMKNREVVPVTVEADENFFNAMFSDLVLHLFDISTMIE